MKSNEQIVSTVLKRITLTLMQELPEPTCVLEKEKWKWKVQEIKQHVANELSHQGLGIKIEV